MIKNFLIIVFCVVLFSGLGAIDYYEEMRKNEEYCFNVKEGYWPDYALKYDKICKEETGH